jgi:hypothetical protein
MKSKKKKKKYGVISSVQDSSYLQQFSLIFFHSNICNFLNLVIKTTNAVYKTSLVKHYLLLICADRKFTGVIE